MKFTFQSTAENILEKRENACHQRFLLVPQCIQTCFFSQDHQKLGIK